MYLFESLKELAASYLEPQQVEQLTLAYITARDAHDGQMRSSGDPYITHPVAVARILGEMRLDHETLMAALLHDVIEDTPTTKADLATLFGDTVAELVEGVSKLDKLKFRDREEAQAENFRKMVMAMVKDIRVILIKLADRTHNMRTLGSLRPDKMRRIARETLEIYVPLANRLGIHNVKNELEDLGFRALHPMRYRVLKEVVFAARGNRKELMNSIEAAIQGRLEDSAIKATVYGREKNLFSIYKKMVSKELQFQDVMDIYAFRITVDDIDTCYRVLGAMHNLYKPRHGRFKDYIAIPKANGYQSLHTSLYGPHQVPVEIQIRTEEMDQMADRGVAAHWLYKNQEDGATAAQIRVRKWMQTLMELQQSAGNSFEFIESVKNDMFPDEIYVFSPKGRILELPAGATAVDFAYAVHTDIGNECVGARVNRQAYPLSKALESGQTVEIITAPGARPNAAWLNFAVTGKARAKIRHVLKNVAQTESVTLGRRLLNHALGDLRLDDIDADKLQQVIDASNYDSLEQLLSAIGLGNVMSLVVAQRLRGEAEIVASSRDKMPIKGAEGMLVTFAKCCRPIEGDDVVAHVSPGKGLVVHIDTCRNIAKQLESEPEKFLTVEWTDDVDAEYLTELRIELVNHTGALAKLTTVIAEANANIHNIYTEDRDGRTYVITMTLTVSDRVHLANVLRKIRVMDDVIKASRGRN
ncbi:bifunctional GTP diphosphokinase/guanosine-3',5'-bis pyrophosphate 3'-pyrophosphohydrolase [Ferrimonas senticii]|uniref:bifunctional GTP diphosphokinase/guanosine-3',5'-bis pyrophosphate 3'-pyrophosphohydrolase n=1 Tax=Ferrimonas senticii TaxID=394566 RepID=UPI00041C648F|nr:bifunctional GTP diphosphokinase/guanosine-3',5'-bis pyrophosphate 3'-pyrophosphohydrolase [Ferrimonas senticii]